MIREYHINGLRQKWSTNQGPQARATCLVSVWRCGRYVQKRKVSIYNYQIWQMTDISQLHGVTCQIKRPWKRQVFRDFYENSEKFQRKFCSDTWQVLDGKRLPKPEIISQKLYDIMLNCWNFNPTDRPTFDSLYHQLSELRVRRSRMSMDAGGTNNEVYSCLFEVGKHDTETEPYTAENLTNAKVIYEN